MGVWEAFKIFRLFSNYFFAAVSILRATIEAEAVTPAYRLKRLRLRSINFSFRVILSHINQMLFNNICIHRRRVCHIDRCHDTALIDKLYSFFVKKIAVLML